MTPPSAVSSSAVSPSAVSPSAVSRRTLLKGAAVGAAAAVAPVRLYDAAAAEAPAHDGVFGYGVASGDPRDTAVIIWTRATPPPAAGGPVATPGSGLGAPLAVRWEVARDAGFADLARHGSVMTDPDSDHTVKIDVQGLRPYTRYWYRFSAAGQTSRVGRTQTAPDEAGVVHALRMALVSCSNYTGGYFTAYRSIAKRNDLDFVLHVGDYIYEYGNGADRYGPAALVGKRDAVPATETIDLRDYRLRHALHKADPDLQLAHAQHPWITIFDDHEVSNNAWATGAENHQPDTEGSFRRRKREAYKAYLEWMPFRLPSQSDAVPHKGTRFFKRFTFGPLGDLSVLETRQNRSKQVDAPGAVPGLGFIPTGIPAVDAQLADPSRHLPEPEQLQWLKDGLSVGRRWHLIANQTVLSPVRIPGALLGSPAPLLNPDQWDGYQADQAELIGHLAGRTRGDAVVLTGDIHSSWAIDVPSSPAPDGTYTPAGVEFVCPSVTSDGFYEVFGGGTAATAEGVANLVDGVIGAVRAGNPWIKYLDGLGHGFTLVDVTPERVQADFYLTPRPTAALPDPRIVRSLEPSLATSWVSRAGSNQVTAASRPIGPRSDSPR